MGNTPKACPFLGIPQNHQRLNKKKKNKKKELSWG